MMERDKYDYYATPPKAAQLLLNNERFDKNIWEICSGGNHIADVLNGNGYNVRCSDIIKRMTNTEVLDFLSDENNTPWAGDIISNPPYGLKDENGKTYATAVTFIEKAMSLIAVGHKVAMYLPLRFSFGRNKEDFFKEYPPKRIIQPSIVLSCALGGDFKNYKNGKELYVWFVFEKGYLGETETKRVTVDESCVPRMKALGKPYIENNKDNTKMKKIDCTKPSIALNAEDLNKTCEDITDTLEKTLGKSDIQKIMNIIKKGALKNLDTSANDIMALGSNQKDIEPLFCPFFYENEISVLFAESNRGKSILAVQIGEQIARTGRKVCYLDFELTTKQFQQRYTNEVNKSNMHKWSDNFYRPILDQFVIDHQDNMIDGFFELMEDKVKKDDTRVFILDNITYMCERVTDAKAIKSFMERLKEFKKKYGISILIVAHTPKRRANKPLDQNDLAGSKMLFNFADSVFAIGKSIFDSTLLYLKQIKVRMGKFIYNEDNVMLCRIVKDINYLRFEHVGNSKEVELLDKKHQLQVGNEESLEKAWELHQEGLSNRKIAKELGVSDKTIAKWIARMEEKSEYVIAPAFAC